MTYKESITAAMASLAQDPKTIFVGYGLQRGRAMGTIPRDANVLETPVAENLMAGLAIGLSLAGRLPVVYFERMDFILNALDAIVNHLAAAEKLSRGEFAPAAIIRCTVGNSQKPLFTGPVHTQDFTEALRAMGLTVIRLETPDDIQAAYATAATRQLRGETTVLVEYKDLM